MVEATEGEQVMINLDLVVINSIQCHDSNLVKTSKLCVCAFSYILDVIQQSVSEIVWALLPQLRKCMEKCDVNVHYNQWSRSI